MAGGSVAKSTKIKRAGRAVRIDITAPTDEQMRSPFVIDEVTHVGEGAAITIGKVFRRKPMYLVLADLFSDAEIKALKHYRHHADIADRSPLRDSLDKQIRISSGFGPTVEVVNAMRVRDDCERAAGSLKDILRAVIVYDWSLSQWAMQKGGALDVCREKEGKVICRMEPRRKVLEIAQLEIKMAAKRVMAELDA